MEPIWDVWVAEKKAKAVPGVVDFAKAATAKGVTILYVSNRAVHLKDATLANLKAVGMPVANDDVFLGLGTVVPGCEQDGSEKNCRRRLAEIGRAHVCTPVTNAHLVCRLLLEQKNILCRAHQHISQT